MEYQREGADAGTAAWTREPMTERERLRHIGSEAAKMPTEAGMPHPPDIVRQLGEAVCALFELLAKTLEQIKRAELLEANLYPEPSAEDPNRPAGLYDRPDLAEHAFGRAQQLLDGINMHKALQARLDHVLARCERKLYGEG